MPQPLLADAELIGGFGRTGTPPRQFGQTLPGLPVTANHHLFLGLFHLGLIALLVDPTPSTPRNCNQHETTDDPERHRSQRHSHRSWPRRGWSFIIDIIRDHKWA